MLNKIIYISHYGNKAIQNGARAVSGAAVSKIDYIVDVMQRMGLKVEMLSAAGCMSRFALPEQHLHMGNGYSIKLRKAYPRHSIKGCLFDSYITNRFLNLNMRDLGSRDIVVCYHATDYIEEIIKLKKTTGFKLILEIEEVYSDVVKNDTLRARENAIFEAADGFLLSTKLLAQHNARIRDKPCAVCCGIYRMAPKVAEKRGDNLTHIVYAGTLDPQKGGAAAAAAAGAFLDAGYALHILGGGSDGQIASIKAAVEEANGASGGCKITYEGLKFGREFDEFIQSCHIGLSPQNPDADFNTTSFPSKIFMYLANGLDVVSVDLPVLTSEIRAMLTVVPDNSALSIAEGVAHARLLGGKSNEGAASRMALLDKRFSEDLNELFSSIQ